DALPIFVDDRDLVEVARLPGALALALGGDQLLLLVAQAGGELEVLGVDRGLLAAAHVGDLLVELLELRRRGGATDPQAGPGLVDEVDRLVRQESVADVA